MDKQKTVEMERYEIVDFKNQYVEENALILAKQIAEYRDIRMAPALRFALKGFSKRAKLRAKFGRERCENLRDLVDSSEFN